MIGCPNAARPRRRGSLARRMSLLAAAAALITAAVAGGLSVNLIHSATQQDARRQLGKLANVAQSAADDSPRAGSGQLRAVRTLGVLRIDYASISAAGQITADDALARAAIQRINIPHLLAGASISTTMNVRRQSVLIEGRRTNAGAIVLVQRRVDALAVGQRAIQRLLLALAIAVALAVALALVMAWRLARPLRRTAEAAHALAGGRRDVIVVPEGPAEVAAVGAALNALASGLAHSEARQREFLLSVSHDLRTPLTAISGYAESLADGMIAAESVPQVGAVMLAEAQRLGRLVADLLDLARLDAAEFRVDLVDVDVAHLARAAAQVWASRCAAVGVNFHLECPPPPLMARTDPSRLRQVLDGLLDNALRMTPAGAPIVLAVGRETHPARPGVVLAEVRDGGPGLSDADLLVAFDRSALYNRYRGVRQVGTGLGLAIVHGLVTRLGGTVEAGHSPEGGARFTVRLPPVS